MNKVSTLAIAVAGVCIIAPVFSQTYHSAEQCDMAMETAEAEAKHLGTVWDDCAAGVRGYTLAPNCRGRRSSDLLLRYAQQRDSAINRYKAIREICRAMHASERNLKADEERREQQRRQAQRDTDTYAQAVARSERERHQVWAAQQRAQEQRREPIIVPIPSGHAQNQRAAAAASMIGLIQGMITSSSASTDDEELEDTPMTDKVYEDTKALKALTQKAMPPSNAAVAKKVQDESLKELRAYHEGAERSLNDTVAKVEHFDPGKGGSTSNDSKGPNLQFSPPPRTEESPARPLDPPAISCEKAVNDVSELINRGYHDTARSVLAAAKPTCPGLLTKVAAASQSTGVSPDFVQRFEKN